MICLSLGVGVEGGGSYHFTPTAALSLTNYSVPKIPQMRHQGFIQQIEALQKNKTKKTPTTHIGLHRAEERWRDLKD